MNHTTEASLDKGCQSTKSILTGVNCLIGITGGIAAYKIPEVVRRLRDNGANVRVVMTEGAKAFITPLTLQAVSGHPVATTLLDESAEAAMGHIELAKWADIVVVAPASADFIGRLNAGLANDLLTTLLLATAAPIAIVPAMNQQMYHSALVQRNLRELSTMPSIKIWGPALGSQACGDIGKGRMIEPSEIVTRIQHEIEGNVSQNPEPQNEIEHAEHDEKFTERKDISLRGLRIMITAGPTREALDPVRYISNHSSGKMGYSIAQAASLRGALVTLISGPVNLPKPEGVEMISVVSALEMYQAVHQKIEEQDIFIGTAAVADYRMQEVNAQKIKKKKEQVTLALTLVQNPDIIHSVAQLKKRPYVVGFAAETQEVAKYAQDKLKRKDLDMICANDVSDVEIGFNSDNNQLLILTKGGIEVTLKDSKIELAHTLLTMIKNELKLSQ